MARPHQNQNRLRNTPHPPLLHLHPTPPPQPNRQRNPNPRSRDTGSTRPGHRMNHKQVQLRRLFSSSIGGSWGDPPEEGDVVLPCVRGTDLDFRRLRVKPDSAPLRSYTGQEVAYRAASQGDIIIEKSGGGDKQPVGRIALWDRFEPVMPTNFAGRLRPSPGHEPRYLAYLLAALYYEGRTVAAIKQTTGIQNLDLHAFLSTPGTTFGTTDPAGDR